MVANKRKADEAPEGPVAAQKQKPPVAVSGAAATASGAPPRAPVAPLSITHLLETENASQQQSQPTEWVRQVKSHVDQSLHGFLEQRKLELSFALPPKCSMIPPLAITQAASGANLTAFREVMNYDNLVASFSRTKQYEAAGTVFMLDPVCSDNDAVTVSQLDGAMSIWSNESFLLSSKGTRPRGASPSTCLSPQRWSTLMSPSALSLASLQFAWQSLWP